MSFAAPTGSCCLRRCAADAVDAAACSELVCCCCGQFAAAVRGTPPGILLLSLILLLPCRLSASPPPCAPHRRCLTSTLKPWQSSWTWVSQRPSAAMRCSGGATALSPRWSGCWCMQRTLWQQTPLGGAGGSLLAPEAPLPWAVAFRLVDWARLPASHCSCFTASRAGSCVTPVSPSLPCLLCAAARPSWRGCMGGARGGREWRQTRPTWRTWWTWALTSTRWLLPPATSAACQAAAAAVGVSASGAGNLAWLWAAPVPTFTLRAACPPTSLARRRSKRCGLSTTLCPRPARSCSPWGQPLHQH